MRPEELHVIRIKRELDDMLQKNTLNKKRLIDLMEKLSTLAVDTDLLQRTQVGRSVNNVRKAYASSKDINQRAVSLIKQWKHLVKAEHDTRRKSISSTHSDEGIKVPDYVGAEVQISSPESSTFAGDEKDREQQFSPVLSNDGDDHAYFHPSRSYTKHHDDGPRPAKIARSESISSTTSSTPPSDSGDTSGSNSKSRDETRNKSVELLRQALLSGEEGPSRSHPTGKTSMELAMEIEQYIFDEFGSAEDRHYKARIRSRVTNLRDKKNPSLRNSILSGTLSPKRVARMSVDELANDQMKKLRRSIEEESIRSREIGGDVANARTDTYQCEECGHRDTSYSITQERVDGEYEPIAIGQLVCNKCGHRWRTY